MKKLTTSSILFIALVFIAPIQVSAATTPGVKPGSFFYFLDTTFENVGLFFTFNPKKKAQKALEYADERLAEIEAIAEEKNPDAVKTALVNYESNIALATEKSKEVKDKGQAETLLTSIADNSSRNQEVLSAVLIKVPEEAKEAIAQAIEASKKGQEEATKQVAELKSEVERSYDVSVENKKATTTVISTAKISQQKEATTKENRKSITSSSEQQAETNPQKENILALTRSKEYHPSEYLGTPAIEAFIKNQSQDSFREFCNTAKTIIGHGETRHVFNEDRTALVSREVTLYEEIPSCSLFLKEDDGERGKNYLWTTNPEELLLELDILDSDDTRKIKLQYNDRIKTITANTLVGYVNDDRIKLSPDQIGYQIVLVERSISTRIPKEEITHIKTLKTNKNNKY